MIKEKIKSLLDRLSTLESNTNTKIENINTNISNLNSLKLNSSANPSGSNKIQFAVDSSGNYGYIPAGADSVIPFRQFKRASISVIFSTAVVEEVAFNFGSEPKVFLAYWTGVSGTHYSSIACYDSTNNIDQTTSGWSSQFGGGSWQTYISSTRFRMATGTNKGGSATGTIYITYCLQ